MSLSDLMSNLKDKVGELKSEALKFKNKNFLNAAMAGSALLALADGEITPDDYDKCYILATNVTDLSDNDIIYLYKKRWLI